MRGAVQTDKPCPVCEGRGSVPTGTRTLTYDPDTAYSQPCLPCRGGGRVIVHVTPTDDGSLR